ADEAAGGVEHQADLLLVFDLHEAAQVTHVRERDRPVLDLLLDRRVSQQDRADALHHRLQGGVQGGEPRVYFGMRVQRRATVAYQGWTCATCPCPGSTWRRSRAVHRRVRRSEIASISHATSSSGATAATGSPSTTTCRASPARRRRCSSRTSPRQRTRSEWAQVGSCCLTIRRWSWPSSSACSRRCTPAASISGSPAP